MEKLPLKKHEYQNHHIDSTIWNLYSPRNDDIVLSTSIKSGTTWMQYIIYNLLFYKEDIDISTFEMSPWLEERSANQSQVISVLERQDHRRLIKTHLPLDGLTYHKCIKYVVVARDARDVFMSLWNHYRNLAPRVYSHLNTEIPNLVGGELPECPVNIIKFWEDWIGTGWFDWESEGYPFWSNLHHTQSWWDYRHLDNILMIHYSDLISNPCHQIRKVAKYLDIGMSSKDIEEISIRTSFDKMKERSDTFLEDAGSSFIGGSKTFFNKGVDGRWRGVLGDKELAKYNSKIRDILTDDCRYWLERDES